MDALPAWAQVLILIALLLASGFFSISEISMMALNRYRLKSMVEKGSRNAIRVSRLLDKTENLLGTILIGNNVVNAALTALVTALAIRYFGNNDTVLLLSTVAISVALILFCEIGPKVVGATVPEKVALPASLGAVSAYVAAAPTRLGSQSCGSGRPSPAWLPGRQARHGALG